MKNPTDADAYYALFRSYENANKEIKELQAHLAYERERNANNVANADYQIAELRAEITRLRSGGCAREQNTTQWCGAMQEMVSRLTALAEEWDTEECYDKGRDETLEWCANRLRKAISGKADAICFRCGKCGKRCEAISDALECCQAKEGE